MFKLPLAPDCTRRTLLRGVGAAAALSCLPSCNPGSDLPNGRVVPCGSTFCVDLTDSANKPLLNVGGAVLIDAFSDTLMLIRSSETEIVALSAICTHLGCSMNFDAKTNLLVCPCHGSEFDEMGNVVKGPASTGLNIYSATLLNDTLTLGPPQE